MVLGRGSAHPRLSEKTTASMNDWTASQIRELISAEIVAERRHRDALRVEDRDRFEEYKKSVSKALALQAKEYERRLYDLNHAHAEAQRVLATYLPREVYERAHAEVVETLRKAELRAVETEARIKKIELGIVDLPGGVKSLEIGLASQNSQQTGTRTAMTTAITIVGLAVSAAVGLIAVLNYLSR